MRNETLILFDYGGVVALNNRDEASEVMCQIFGVDRTKLRAILNEEGELGQAFRKGELTESEFWSGIAEQLSIARSELPEDHHLSRLWSERYQIDDSVLKFVGKLRQRHSVGILTNIDCARDRYLIEELKLGTLFDVHFASWRFRATKQTTELWMLVDEEVRQVFSGLHRVVFIDDRLEHVRSGKAVGWHTIHYENLLKLKHDLSLIGIMEE